MEHNSHIIIAGAAPDTGNAGVSALLEGAVYGLSQRGSNHHYTILDHGLGDHRLQSSVLSMSNSIQFHTLKSGKRWYSSDNIHNANIRQKFNLKSPFTKLLNTATAYLDVSGGDSFTDLYGQSRFKQITMPKIMALRAGVPLILLPQTYGPFKCEKNKAIAQNIISQSHCAIARDEDSFHAMKSILKNRFNPDKHLLGLDLAFGLPVAPAPCRLETLLSSHPVGINVSGLLWNKATEARKQFSLKADYKQCLIDLIHKILTFTNKNILFVPHVMPNSKEECDVTASHELKSLFPHILQKRIFITETSCEPQILKSIISKCCWFTGARMHATIAALTTETPVANMAYSDKAAGIFTYYTCRNQVQDLRKKSTDEIVEGLLDSYRKHDEIQLALKEKHPQVMRCWNYQMDNIYAAIQSLTIGKVNRHA